MIDLKDLIEGEIDQYLEWPTADKSHVTTVSAKLFAEHVARLYADHITEAGKMAAPAVQGEPVATIHVDGSFVHVAWRIPAPSRCAMDVYTAPQPAEQQPDVAQLVEALECMIIGACAVAVPHNGERAVLQDAVNLARAALAAYRKQQEGDA